MLKTTPVQHFLSLRLDLCVSTLAVCKLRRRGSIARLAGLRLIEILSDKMSWQGKGGGKDARRADRADTRPDSTGLFGSLAQNCVQKAKAWR